MKKKNSKAKIVNGKSDLEILQRKILDDLLARKELKDENRENPSVEKEKQIALLTEEIEKNQRISGVQTFPGMIEVIDNVARLVVNGISSTGGAELLELGDDSFHVQVLQRIIGIRNDFDDIGRHFMLQEDAQKVMERFDDFIAKLKQSIEETRKNAAAHFPELARKNRQPDFEMSDYYKQAVANIMQMVEKRDRLVADFKNVLPHKRQEFFAGIAEMDKLIDESEQFLAERYEAFQKKQRWIDGLRKMFKEASQSELHGMRRHLKEHPGENPEIEKLMAEEFPEEK
jgi:hypothetical protein